MAVLNVILSVLIVVAALILIVTVLLQNGDTSGLGALSGQKDSYFNKNKGKTIEAKLALGTKVAAAAFVVLSLAVLLINKTW